MERFTVLVCTPTLAGESVGAYTMLATGNRQNDLQLFFQL